MILILVHRRELLSQWVERLGSFLQIDPKLIGTIGAGKRKPTGVIDVALIQSLVRKGEVDDIVADYGPFLTAAIATQESSAMPWDGHYSIATPGHSFSVLFNMATTLRNGPRRPGGSLMLFRGARGASALMEQTDAQIEQAFRWDLLDAFPEAAENVGDIIVQRWPLGAPYAGPGRATIQRDLTAPLGPVFLAGDYLEFPNMEAAVTSGQDSAHKVQAVLSPPGDFGH